MIINMASTSAYDENEVQLEVVAEKGEIIKIDELKEIDSCYSKLALNNDYEAFWDKLYSYADKNMKQ